MKHAAIIPLAGGAAIGATQATGNLPQYMASWNAFAKNDSYCRQYYKDVPFYLFDGTHEIKNVMKALTLPKNRVDLITCVPPCSGLSTATPSTARGCKAPQNLHMLNVAEMGMLSGTKVILIENAPTLYSKGGQEFAERFLPLCKKYDYKLVLYKTSTILHGLPQNRVRSFAILYKGAKVPEFNWIKKPYTPLHEMKVVKDSKPAKDWKPYDDEIIEVLMKEFGKPLCFLDKFNLPLTAWKLFTDHKLKHRFKTEPYRYMQRTSEAGNGIMDRSPYLVWDHCNALMWKSAHKMLNPAAPHRQFNIRELMNLMGLPQNYKEIPAKDINILFQNVPVNTVKTLTQEIMRQLDSGKWYKPTENITRVNNIKQTIEIF